MSSSFQIRPARSDDDIEAVARLFELYAASLPIDLGYQDFATEVASLPGKYAPPKGELLLARRVDGTPLGCVALRALAAEGECEVKRLYLLPAARGLGLGKALVQAVIEAARERRYAVVRLDTLEVLVRAIRLYDGLGFIRTEAYYAPTPPGTVFMRLDLG